MPRVSVRKRRDGIHQIRPGFLRSLPARASPLHPSIALVLCAAGLHLGALVPGVVVLAVAVACTGWELLRSLRARRLSSRPLAEVQELPLRRRAG